MLLPCRHCARHVRVTELTCPFCAGSAPTRGLSPGPEPSSRLSRAAQLAFYVTLGAAVVRCVQQPEREVVAMAPPPARIHAPLAGDATAADAASDAGDAALDARSPGMIAIYGESTNLIFEEVSFEIGRADVREENRFTLEAIAEVLQNHPFVIEVRGHNDSKESGWKLSERRAKAVKKALVALGVPENRLRVRDLGVTEPRSPQPHENARVSFAIVESPDAR